MAIVQPIPSFRPLSSLLTGLVLLLAASLPARAHIVPLADMLRGIRMTQAQCAAIPMTVWLKVMGRDFCIRYYLSTAGGEGTRPVVFLQGDKFGRLNFRTGEFALTPRDKDIDTDDFERWAEKLSKAAKGPAIYLARAGIDGSSGHHSIRRSVLELHVTNAALDAIKQRHRFEGYHLYGQSGGSALIGGMLALRSDIACAAIGSGRLASNRPQRRPADPAAAFFNPADAIATIAQRRATRILVVTDPADRKVPEAAQTGFVRMLRQAGGQAEQFMVQATDNDRHGVAGYARTAAIGCMLGKSTQEIAQRLQRQVERNLAAKAKSGMPQAANAAPPPSNSPSNAMTAQPAARR